MDKKKTAAAAAVTAAAIAGIATNQIFDSPTELVPEAVANEAQEESLASGTQEKTAAVRVRGWVLGLPAAVRMLVVVPLWCLGWVLLSALSVFWAGTEPLLSGLLNWMCLAAVLLGVFSLSVKAAFPQLSFRRILRVRNAVSLVLLSAGLWAADLALPAVWQGYDPVSRIVWRVGAVCLLAFFCGMELKRHGKRAAKAYRELPKRTAVEEEARRLADTVCK